MSTKIETTVLTEDIKTQLNELCDEYYDCNQAYKVAETNKKMYTDAIKQVFKEQNISIDQLIFQSLQAPIEVLLIFLPLIVFVFFGQNKQILSTCINHHQVSDP